MKLSGSFEVVPFKFQRLFKSVSNVFQGCFKGLSVNFHGGFMRVFKKVLRVFHGRLHFQLELL